MPARAISALIRALAVPRAFRFWQGDSTKPAIGSQTRPMTFFRAVAAASSDWRGVPPRTDTMPAAAMAAADPVSAWQPPSAPDTVALRVIIIPIAPETKSASMTWSSLQSNCSAVVSKLPGRIPQDPAVGAATIRPIEALTSMTPMAAPMALDIQGPQTVGPESRRSFNLLASPPSRPPIECNSSLWARSTASRITS